MRLTVSKIEDRTDRIRSIFLIGDNLPGWTAGAHLDFDLEVGTRAYSLIDRSGDPSSPSEYEIAVQREDDGDGGSRAMHALKVGDVVEAAGPANDFPLADDPALLIAGGIGITPMISMAAALKAKGAGYTLHYAARSRAVAGFVDELTSAHGEECRLHFDDEAMIDLKAVIAAAGDAHLYLCGPKPMIEAGQAIAREAGLPEYRIQFELFANEGASGDSFEVELASTGDVYEIPSDKSIIEVLEEAGHDLMYDCQRGDCGICQTDVLEGEPDHRDVVLSAEEKAAGKVMQICVSRAKSARLKLDL